MMKSLSLAPALLLSTALAAQSNVIFGLDLKLADVDGLQVNGVLAGDWAFAMEACVCNVGSTPAMWTEPMSSDHPKYAFMMTRLLDGRLVQISDRTWIRHEWLADNDDECNTCQQIGGPAGTLGVGCSTRTFASDMANPYYLGPPGELDPWLGEWAPIGSHFDLGEPPVSGPQAVDGLRSLSPTQVAALGSFTHRMIVDSADLHIPGADYFYGAQVIIAGEDESLRDDNIGSRQVSIDMGGGSIYEVDALQHGSVLERWPGATVNSDINVFQGNPADGRFYAAVVATELPSGLWHYEYAVHNRDNAGGACSFEVECCASTTVSNVGFSDIDGDPLNDWTHDRPIATTLRWQDTTGNNAQPYNTIYNFWFDCDIPPFDAEFTIVQADPVNRAPTITLTMPTPRAPASAPIQYGTGCGTPAPVLSANGPATIPNPNFEMICTNAGNSNLVSWEMSIFPGNLPFQGCTFLLSNQISIVQISADTSGTAVFPVPIPVDPTLDGVVLFFQCFVLDPISGQLLGLVNLSNGLEVPIGCD